MGRKVKSLDRKSQLNLSHWPSDQEVKLQQRETNKRAVRISFISSAVLFGIAVYWLCHLGGSLLSGICGNEILHRSFQPNGSLELVVFRRDCGATTGYSYHLSILKRGSESDLSGNVLVSTKAFQAEWSGSHSIAVIGDANDASKRIDRYRGIRIEYRS